MERRYARAAASSFPYERCGIKYASRLFVLYEQHEPDALDSIAMMLDLHRKNMHAYSRIFPSTTWGHTPCRSAAHLGGSVQQHQW